MMKDLDSTKGKLSEREQTCIEEEQDKREPNSKTVTQTHTHQRKGENSFFP